MDKENLHVTEEERNDQEGDFPVIITNSIDEESQANTTEEDHITLLRRLVSAVDTLATAVLCEKCANDFTASHEDVVHDWKSQVHLKRHWQQYHNPARHAARLLASKGCQKNTSNRNVKWCCDACQKMVKTLSELIRHIHETHEATYAPDEFEIINAAIEESNGSLRVSDGQNRKTEDASRNLKGKWTCPECQVDVSCTQEHRDRLWSVGEFKDHQKTQFHQPVEQCIRILLSLDAKLEGSKLRVRCPWCTQSRIYQSWVAVIQHGVDDMHDESVPEAYMELFRKRLGKSDSSLPTASPLPVASSSRTSAHIARGTSLMTSFHLSEIMGDDDDAHLPPIEELYEDLEVFGDIDPRDLEAFGDIDPRDLEVFGDIDPRDLEAFGDIEMD